MRHRCHFLQHAVGEPIVRKTLGMKPMVCVERDTGRGEKTDYKLRGHRYFLRTDAAKPLSDYLAAVDPSFAAKSAAILRCSSKVGSVLRANSCSCRSPPEALSPRKSFIA